MSAEVMHLRAQWTDVLLHASYDILHGREQAGIDTIADCLSTVDRSAAPVLPVLIELAVTWAQVARSLDTVTGECVAWTRWAVTAAEDRFGPFARETVRARLMLAAALGDYGDDLAAAEQYAKLADAAGRVGNPMARVRAREVRALALHNGGCCQAAIDELRNLVREPPAVPVRPREEYLGQIACMLAACGRTCEATLFAAAAGLTTVDFRVAAGPIADVNATHGLLCERRSADTRDWPSHPATRHPDWTDLL